MFCDVRDGGTCGTSDASRVPDASRSCAAEPKCVVPNVQGGAAFPSLGGGLSATWDAARDALALVELDCDEIEGEDVFHVATTAAAAGALFKPYAAFAEAPRIAEGGLLADALAGFVATFADSGAVVRRAVRIPLGVRDHDSR